ncbi:MAG: hypothetical protein O3A14_05655 [Cyanobacteria bacterium]|nr:hypothetical protein [Cyanobacteriota bacterium]
MLILADVLPGPVLVMGATILIGAELLVTLGEALLLWWMKWSSFPRALLDSVVMNITSGFLGTFLGVMMAIPLISLGGLPEILRVLIAFLPYWFMTVAIEGVVLLLLRQKPPRQTWITVLKVNLISYSLLIPSLLWLLSQG